eukprot:GFYU01017745.1.p1 GENE.GFYU01017745.1~~GFYU01017745.1.p1  ORF type:complete len:364 (-),score=37.65 GFYU01017745.1:120-1157(-)
MGDPFRWWWDAHRALPFPQSHTNTRPHAVRTSSTGYNVRCDPPPPCTQPTSLQYQGGMYWPMYEQNWWHGVPRPHLGHPPSERNLPHGHAPPPATAGSATEGESEHPLVQSHPATVGIMHAATHRYESPPLQYGYGYGPTYGMSPPGDQYTYTEGGDGAFGRTSDWRGGNVNMAVEDTGLEGEYMDESQTGVNVNVDVNVGVGGYYEEEEDVEEAASEGSVGYVFVPSGELCELFRKGDERRDAKRRAKEKEEKEQALEDRADNFWDKNKAKMLHDFAPAGGVAGAGAATSHSVPLRTPPPSPRHRGVYKDDAELIAKLEYRALRRFRQHSQLSGAVVWPCIPLR